MRFIKMHGLGNDYVYVNGFEPDAAPALDDPASLATVIADRHTGVGGDGLILVLPPEPDVDAHVRMRMFNADGSESEMCGNGIRCVCKLAYDHGITSAHPMRVQTGRGVLTLDYTLDHDGKVDQVTVDMGEPILPARLIPFQADDVDPQSPVINYDLRKHVQWPADLAADWIDHCGFDARMTCVSMGNPHAVLYCDQVSDVDLMNVGPTLEHHPMFPNRVNVHFVQVHSPTEVTVRHWERGSGPTLACGTGACAVCVAGVLTGRTSNRITAHLPGGGLTLHWSGKNHPVQMTGPATEVFTGHWPAPVPTAT